MLTCSLTSLKRLYGLNIVIGPGGGGNAVGGTVGGAAVTSCFILLLLRGRAGGSGSASLFSPAPDTAREKVYHIESVQTCNEPETEVLDMTEAMQEMKQC